MGKLELWRALVNRALREAESLQVFCREHPQYSQYEVGIDDLVRQLEMDAITASNMSDTAIATGTMK